MDNIVNFPDRKKAIHLLDDIIRFSIDHYSLEVMEMTESMLDNMNISKELSEKAHPHIVYWFIFCKPFGDDNITIYERYLSYNRDKWEDRSEAFHDTLMKWSRLSPGFYYVDYEESISDNAFLFRDVYEGEPKFAWFSQKEFQTPLKGSVVSGLLMPLEDGLFTPLGDVFQIPEHLNDEIVREVTTYFEKHHTSQNYMLNPQLFPSLLHITLEIMEKHQ
ncbi:hypothetical protein [Virgibacillus ainsalahensis]